MLGGRLSTFDARTKEFEEAIQSAQQQAKAKKVELGKSDAELAEHKLRFEKSDSQLQQLKKNVAEQREQHNDLVSTRADLAHTLSERREKRSGLEARRQILEDLETRQEGIGVGVKEILERARENDFPPWDKIQGSVADLIQVDMEHAALIEVALGTRTQLIVLDDADPLLEYLQEETCHISGRVGFLALSSEEEIQTLQSSVDLMGRPGVIERADRFVQAAQSAPQLAIQLLANTWVVHSLRAALELAQGDGQGCRFVTLQGELLEADGTLFAGTLQSETSLVSRRSELRRLKNDVIRLGRQIEQTEAEFSAKETSLQASSERLATLENEEEQFASGISELKSAVLSQQIESERLQRDVAESQEKIVKN